MKKCASCTKDLPDAALHCVFCGAKQPPAPAVAGSVAKTVMGHASSEMVAELKAAAAAAARNQPPPAAAPVRPGNFVPTPGPAPGPAPSPAAVAPTMFVPGGPAPMNPMSGPPIGGPMGGGPAPMGPGPGPMGPGPMGPGPGPGPMGPGPAPMLPPTSMPGPAPNPYAPKAARPGRPIEPWKDSLRLMMYIWGGALLLAFMTPFSVEPDLRFMFQTIIDGDGLDKLFPIIIAAAGILSIVLAIIPSSPMPRGLMAAALGVVGIMVPNLLFLSHGEFGLPQILELVGLLGVLTIVPGLLLRSEYRDAMLPRILVTVGVLCVLAPTLIPQNDSIPLVEHFKALADAPGKEKVKAIVELGPVLLAALSLLAWLPAPSSAGAKVFAWLWITWGAVALYTTLFVEGEIGAALEASPYLSLVAWVAGFAGKFIGAAFLALTGYGLATVFGKQLE